MKVQTHKKEVRNDIKEQHETQKEKYDRINGQVTNRKLGILQEKEMIGEKHRLHEKDAL